tara:strand:- start:5 stop:343 length:339 start_codon:yes stop_codon:yes gene_type:complete
MSDNIITPLHLQTIEGYMASTSASVQKLAESVNELVISERERAIRDEQMRKELEDIKLTLKENEKGIAFSTWLYRMFDNYIIKIGFPFAMTLIIFIMVANYVDISALTGKGK